MYRELVTLRQNNRILETRVKTLEKQNVEISKSLDFVGNNEPSRPVMVNPAMGNKKKSVRYSEDHSLNMSPSESDMPPLTSHRSILKQNPSPMDEIPLSFRSSSNNKSSIFRGPVRAILDSTGFDKRPKKYL